MQQPKSQIKNLLHKTEAPPHSSLAIQGTPVADCPLRFRWPESWWELHLTMWWTGRLTSSDTRLSNGPFGRIFYMNCSRCDLEETSSTAVDGKRISPCHQTFCPNPLPFPPPKGRDGKKPLFLNFSASLCRACWYAVSATARSESSWIKSMAAASRSAMRSASWSPSWIVLSRNSVSCPSSFVINVGSSEFRLLGSSMESLMRAAWSYTFDWPTRFPVIS